MANAGGLSSSLLLIAALLQILAITVTSCQNLYSPRACTSHSKTYRGVKNHALLQSVYQVKAAKSSVTCANYCSANSSCASFNYHSGEGLCKLSDAIRANFPHEFVKELGSVYFDMDPVPGTQYPCPLPEDDSKRFYISCKQLLEDGYNQNGVYTIYPDGLCNGLRVYCDQEKNGGGWIVFQRRQDGSVDFYRDWKDYRAGFGNLMGEFWLGNDILRHLTESTVKWELKIDLEDFEGNNHTARYDDFAVSGDTFVLTIGAYSGDAGDALIQSRMHLNQAFTTRDRDNDQKADENCARSYEGAWWFGSCHWSHLNGKYYHHGNVALALGVQWGAGPWTGYVSLRKTSMELREIL